MYRGSDAQVSSFASTTAQAPLQLQEDITKSPLCLLASEVCQAKAKDGISYKTDLTASDKLSTVFLYNDQHRAERSSYHHIVISFEIFITQAAW